MPKLTLDLSVKVLPEPVELLELEVTGTKFSFLADMHMLAGHGSEFEINKFFPGRPWMSVEVNKQVPINRWYIPLDRARRELERHESKWGLELVDYYAVHYGALVWHPVLKQPRCRYYDSEFKHFCPFNADRKVWYGTHYVPLCTGHHREVQRVAAAKRRGE